MKFYRLPGATFYDCINTIYQFIKHFFDNKMSIFEEYGTFNYWIFDYLWMWSWSESSLVAHVILYIFLWLWLIQTSDLRYWKHLIDFLPFFTRETTFVTSWLFSCTTSPFWKWVYSKRKEFAPIGSKFFPFRVDLYSEGVKSVLTELHPLEV